MSGFTIVNVFDGEVWFSWPESGHGPYCLRDEDLDQMEEAIRKAKDARAEKIKRDGGK